MLGVDNDCDGYLSVCMVTPTFCEICIAEIQRLAMGRNDQITHSRLRMLNCCFEPIVAVFVVSHVEQFTIWVIVTFTPQRLVQE